AKSVPYTQEIVLRKDQNVFSVEFAALSYLQPRKNKFAARLVGFESDWQYIGNEYTRTYTNLDPGWYQLEVKAANNDGKWSENKSVLNIQVLPPWYNTWWAWMLYACLFGMGVYAFLRAQRQALETRRTRELEAEKARFYVGITHQFRTPLTLIQGPVKLALTDSTYRLNQGRLEKILDNCGQLLGLIDRLLQLSKIEAGFLSPRMVHGDVIPVMANLVDAFQEIAAAGNLKLSFISSNDVIRLDYDHSLLVDIINNLLANAVKYTPEGGVIEVKAACQEQEGGRLLVVEVADNGRAIPEEEKDKIFDRFYRVNTATDISNPSGTGIGLALSRRLAELLGGTLSLQTGSQRGNTFYLALPIHEHAPKEPLVRPADPAPYLAIKKVRPAKNLPPLTVEDLPLVLIIEDQAAVAAHIMECLQSSYRLHWAENGQEGLDWAYTNGPDLIISDVMMPKLNGFVVCQQLKTNFTTSHLPVVLLTARADQDSRLSGLTKGADAYLAKPFDPRELRVRCEQLVLQRQRLANYYQQLVAVNIAPPPTNDLELPVAEQEEYAFVLKVKVVVEQRFMEQDFNVQQLAKELSLDRTTLTRKLKSLAQITPTELIRSVRIREAQKLLADPSYNVAEVAYACGFSDPDYFSRLFRQELGDSPSNFRKIR
ncbi:MAG: hybrid sensor histidine kinase/response regulator transcription factor, partial [Bacteroidota bacterium]